MNRTCAEKIVKAILVMALFVPISQIAHADADRSVYAAFYAGPSFTHSSDIRLGTVPPATFKSVESESALGIGGKVGYWHNANWGAAVDIFTQEAELKDQTVAVELGGFSGTSHLRGGSGETKATVVALTVLARYPLGERVAPYAGIGPALFMNKNHFIAGGDASATNLGFAAPLGVEVNLFNREKMSLGFIGEVKFAYNPVRLTVNDIDLETNLLSTNLFFGLALGFNL